MYLFLKKECSITYLQQLRIFFLIVILKYYIKKKNEHTTLIQCSFYASTHNTTA